MDCTSGSPGDDKQVQYKYASGSIAENMFWVTFKKLKNLKGNLFRNISKINCIPNKNVALP